MIPSDQFVWTTAWVVQVDPGVNADVALGEGLVGGAIGAFLTTLIVGGIMIVIAPEYTERMMASVLDDPVRSFVYGIVCLMALVLVSIALAVTIVGIVLAVPLLLGAYLMWAIGSAIAYLAIGGRLVEREGGWAKPLLVGAGINGVLAATGVGGIVAIGIGAAGFGAVIRAFFA